ncbi:MAG: hypothetical protein HY692_05935 [Cyanobacteria bacterium NC_groundwater_1444_Ag_S-0.65um_54_12]|nr:hypothetical protein [Cyanobacteria bacterium NC_groundwater_1444_Ag_S-0.65um_54_12]
MLSAVSLVPGDVADLRPLKPALLSHSWWPWLIGFALLVVVSLVLARRLKNFKSRALPVVSPPLASALRTRLERLRRAGWFENVEQVQFCDVISDILREFVQQKWAISSRRLTTTELLLEMAHGGAEASLCQTIGEILSACDLVKFAAANLTREEIECHLATTLALLDNYRLTAASGADI